MYHLALVYKNGEQYGIEKDFDLSAYYLFFLFLFIFSIFFRFSDKKKREENDIKQKI
jgi:hypothetical protein